jgi:hypothetical protein
MARPQTNPILALVAAFAVAVVAACSSGSSDDLGGAQNPGGPDPGSAGPGQGPGSGGPQPGGPGGPGGPGPTGDQIDTIKDPLYNQLTGQAQLTALCARKLGDAVSTAFCANGGTMPVITSLVDLQKFLGLDFKAGNIGNGTGGNPAFVLTGHSSSLVTKFTSAINPRAIIFTPPKSRGRVGTPAPLASFIAMGFVRGEEFVELVSNDPTNGNKLNFFLFKFQHACSATAAGCTNGDLLTPAVESNFSGVYSLYSEDDIKNTIFDCQQCHQTGGPASQKILRMQELQNPWGHFFRNNRNNGQVLLADYQAAHGTTETYAGIPGAVIFNPNQTNNNGQQTAGGGPDPAALEGLVENQGFKNQPNEYNTGTILKEVQAVNAGQPASNVPSGTSATWLKLYQQSMAGNDIPPPFHDIKVTDPVKLGAATTAYKNVMAGTMPAAQLPDIRDIFLDSALSDMSFRPAANLTGAQILTQICQQCHNKNLDQTETREKFRVDELAAMTREEKDLAIKRLNLPDDVFRKMPPPRFRVLSAAEIQLVTDELKK